MQRIQCLAGFMNEQSSRTGTALSIRVERRGRHGRVRAVRTREYRTRPETAECTPCPPGTYADEEGKSCVTCPWPRTSREGGVDLRHVQCRLVPRCRCPTVAHRD